MTGEEMTRTDPPSPLLLPHPPTCGSPLSPSWAGGAGAAPPCPRTALWLACSRSAARAPGAGRRRPVECRELLTAAGAWAVVVSVCGCCRVLSVLRVWRTLARRPRSERMRGSGSAKRSAVDVVCFGVLSAQLGRCFVSCVVMPAGVLLACLAWLPGFSLRVVRASCFRGLPGAGRDVDGAKTGGDGSGGDGLHPAEGRRALILVVKLSTRFDRLHGGRHECE